MAVRVKRANFDRLAHRYERDGCVEGWAIVDGTWHGSHVSIGEQVPQWPGPSSPRHGHDHTVPPCAEPSGGWPRSHPGDNLNYDAAGLVDSGLAISTVLFRPSEDQVVLVVATADIDAVEAMLRPQLGDQLCVIASRWTRAQLMRTLHGLRSHANDWRVFRSGETADEQGQAHLTARLVCLTREIADWAATIPDGMLTLTPWLRPMAS